MSEMDLQYDDDNESQDYPENEGGYDDEGELGDGENSEEGTVIADEDDVDVDVDEDAKEDGQLDFGITKPMHHSASDTFYDEENDGQPMKEITFTIEQGEESGDDSKSRQNLNTKRGYDIVTEDVSVDPEKKRRKI